MPAPAMSHLICTSALVTLIFVLPLFYTIAVDNIRNSMLQREIQEIADYTSNTIGNLYFIVNSSRYSSESLEKELIYLPPTVENYRFTLTIDETDGNVSQISIYLKDSHIRAHSWLMPGLKIGSTSVVESGNPVIVGCSRNETGIYAWIKPSNV